MVTVQQKYSNHIPEATLVPPEDAFFALMDKLWLWLKEKKQFSIATIFFFNLFSAHKILKNSLILKMTRFLYIISLFVTLIVLKKLCYFLHMKILANINPYPSIYEIKHVCNVHSWRCLKILNVSMIIQKSKKSGLQCNSFIIKLWIFWQCMGQSLISSAIG